MLFTTSISPSWFFVNNPLLNSVVSSNSPIVPIETNNSNIKITVFPEWYRQVSLQWTIPDEWIGSKFHVYYWPGGDEAYVRLTHTPITTYYFSDESTREYSKTQEGFYVVEVYLPNSTKVIRSYPTSWEYRRRDKTERIANEIQRREYLLLSKFSGVKSFFFRKKNYGLRCHRCWNPVQEKVMDDNCEVCYGTSFEGGYFDPIPIFVQYDPTLANKLKTYQGNIEPSNLGAWTISFPQISSDDIIVRTGSWNAYKVISSNPTELQTKPVRQILNLTQFSKSDVENKLVTKIQATDAHQYIQNNMEGKYVKDRIPSTLLDTKQENDYPWAKRQDLQNLPEYKI